MSLLSSLLAAGDVGSTVATGGQAGYTFSQQEKDFIKLQFKYGILLNQKLASGQISQAYHDANLWLTTETLSPPYNGWWTEFQTAINQEDLNWLAKQVGETVDQLVVYMGDALAATAALAGNIVGTAVSSTSSGLLKGFFGSLNWGGWLVVIGIGAATVYAWKKGYIQKSIDLGFRTGKLIP